MIRIHKYVFEHGTDYKTTLERYIDEIDSWARKTLREERKTSITALINAYVDQTGERPSNGALYRLADILLLEELNDPHPDKVTRDEFPILSERQLEGREERETAWGYWHINDDPVVGYRKVAHTDDDGISRVFKQRIQKRT